MRERKWYSRFGIEPPFSWTILFWPFWWVVGFVWESLRKLREPEPLRASDPFWYEPGNGTRTLRLDDGGVLTYTDPRLLLPDDANVELRDINFNLLWRGRVDHRGES